MSTYTEDLFPELPGGNFFTVDFSSKLDCFLLLHYLVSLLPILIGLLTALLHVKRGFFYCYTCYSLAAENSFSKNNASVLHGPPGVHTTVLECVCHCSELHSPEQNTIQPWFVFLSGS